MLQDCDDGTQKRGRVRDGSLICRSHIGGGDWVWCWHRSLEHGPLQILKRFRSVKQNVHIYRWCSQYVLAGQGRRSPLWRILIRYNFATVPCTKSQDLLLPHVGNGCQNYNYPRTPHLKPPFQSTHCGCTAMSFFLQSKQLAPSHRCLQTAPTHTNLPTNK